MSVLICFGSWEERFVLGTLNDLTTTIGINKIVCFYFEDGQHVEETEKNLKKVKQKCSDAIEFQNVKLKLNDYKFSWKLLESSLNEINASDAILNISTMTRNMIFSLIHFLEKLDIKYKVRYYPVESHGTELTKNPSMPEMIFQHGGVMLPDLQTALIVMVGYDTKRVQQLYNFFEPKKILIGIGSNHQTVTPPNYDTSFNEISNKHVFNIDSFSNESVFIKLEELYLDLKDKYNVLVCSLGPKLETIGIYKFHKKNPEVGLVYAPSKDYSENYSKGIKLDKLTEISSDWMNIE